MARASIGQFEEDIQKYGWEIDEPEYYILDDNKTYHDGLIKTFIYEVPDSDKKINIPVRLEFFHDDTNEGFFGALSNSNLVNIDYDKVTFDVTVEAYRRGLTSIDYRELNFDIALLKASVDQVQSIANDYAVIERIGDVALDTIEKCGWELFITGDNMVQLRADYPGTDRTEHQPRQIFSHEFSFDGTAEDFIKQARNEINNGLISNIYFMFGEQINNDGTLDFCQQLMDTINNTERVESVER